MKEPQATPRWETAILVVSFVLLWCWYLARQSAYKAGLQPSIWLSMPLVFVLLALAWVFVRRLRRVVSAMREQKIGLDTPKR